MTKHLSSSRAKRWTVQGLLAASVVGLGIAGLVTQLDRGNPAEAAEVDTQAVPVEPWVYDRLQSIRQELALTNEDMASIGLGLDESKTVFNGLKNWVQDNRQQLEAKDLAQLQARRELQLAQRQVRVGPRDETLIRSLPDLEKALTQAIEAKQSLHADAAKAIEGRLTAAQRSACQTAKANAAAGVPTRYRYATGLDDSQLTTIRASLAKRGIDKRARDAEADLQLYTSQRQAVEAARANHAANMEAVESAEASALPQLLPLETERPVEGE